MKQTHRFFSLIKNVSMTLLRFRVDLIKTIKTNIKHKTIRDNHTRDEIN